MTAKKKMSLAVAAALSAAGLSNSLYAQSIYSDDFNRATLNGGTYNYSFTTYATPNPPGGATTATATVQGPLGTTGNYLQILNGTATNVVGASGVSTPTNVFNGQPGTYNFNLSTSPGAGQALEWRFNERQSRATPSGFGDGNFGAAYILGATDPDFFLAGNGYALIRGSTASQPYFLVQYTGGLRSLTNQASAAGNSIIGALDPTTHFSSIKITYDPASYEWRLYARDDGTSQFTDANNDTGYIFAGKATNNTYASTTLAYTGALFKHASQANNLTQWDNFNLSLITAPPNNPARQLLWSSTTAGAATEGSGTWSTANTWVDQADSSHTTWDGARPDNARFGTSGGGVGSFTVDVASTQFVGMVTFAASSPSYTLANGTLTVLGADDPSDMDASIEGIIANQSSTINSAVNWAGASHIHVNGSGNTLTINGALQGGAKMDKYGSGTLLLTALAPSRTGDLDIQTGTVKVTGMSAAGGVSALGTGQTGIRDGGTLWLDASAIGGTGAVLSGAAGTLFLGDNSTLRVTGTVTYQKNNPVWSFGADPTSARNSTIHVDSGGTLVWRAQMKNAATTGPNFHTIHMDGPGTVKLTNSGSDGSIDPSLYSGDWDVSNGRLLLGQNTETGGSSGDTLNAIGFKNGDPKNGNLVTVRGTGMIIGTENDNDAVPSNPPGVIYYYRGKVTLNGGTLASGNGKDTSWGGNFTVGPTASKVLTYDPLNPATPRSTSLVKGQQDISANQAETVWNGNLTIDPGTTTGGAFNITRDVVTSSVSANPTGVSVTPGATITVLQGATLNLNGTADALSDGTNHVNVNNQSSTSFNVSNGAKNVGEINGTGTTTVASDGSLIATHIIQGTANLNGNTEIRPSSLAVGVSNIRTLNLDTPNNIKLNLQNNKLVTANATGTWNGSAYTDVTGLIAKGKGSSNLWDGPAGIITTQSAAVGSNFTSIGVAKASDVRPATATATGTWAGQTITGTDTLVMYTYGGDANLDGKINVDDYIKIDSGIAAGLTGWSNGDFNYDGKVNIDDYTTVIDANIGNQSGVFFTAGGVGGEGGASGVTAVPEPASLSVLATIGATALLARRSRRQRS